jgi:hypothetical protein
MVIVGSALVVPDLSVVFVLGEIEIKYAALKRQSWIVPPL